jgi:uncharacterized Ntn-hydrolase superfamily protein
MGSSDGDGKAQFSARQKAKDMTFTVLGHCPDTNQIGIGITTASIAVGGLCPFYTAAGDIISSQAFARPELGLLASRHLTSGGSLSELEPVLGEADADFQYRQVAVIRRTGERWVHSGISCRPWSGHLMGNSCAVMGNFLAGSTTVEAMLEAFENAGSVPLADRLLVSLEAGRDAGGQADANGTPARERSSALCVVGAGALSNVHDGAVTPVNLRIDLHEEAVTALRELYETCKQVPVYNALRSSAPAQTPALGDWEAQHSSANPPPSVLHPGRLPRL